MHFFYQEVEKTKTERRVIFGVTFGRWPETRLQINDNVSQPAECVNMVGQY